MIFRRGKDRIEVFTLFASFNTLCNYAPASITKFLDQKIHIDFTTAISLLFSFPTDELVKRWMHENKFGGWSFGPLNKEPWTISLGEAAGQVAQSLVAQGISINKVKEMNFYLQESPIVPRHIPAYLVIAGQIKNVPSSVVVGKLEM